jgi:hypothetical protein
MIWRYVYLITSETQSKKSVFYLTIAPQQSFVDVINILQQFSIKKINKSAFYKVIHGQRSQMYGWSLIFVQLNP